MRTTSTFHSDLLLIAATILATLIVRQHFAAIKPLPAKIPTSRAEHLQPFVSSSIDIQPVGWKEIMLRTYRRIGEDRMLAVAAGTVFYGLLALFPAITALVSSYGLFADTSTIADNLQRLALMLPEGSLSVVQDQVTRVLAKGNAALGFTFIGSLIVALWSANAGMKAIIDALNVVCEEKESRSFLSLNLISLTLTIAALATIVVMASAVVAVPLALQRLGIDHKAAQMIEYVRWPVLGGLLLIALAILYRVGPSRKAPRWQWLSAGAVAATVLWLAGSSILSWYLSNFANYSVTYGSLGAAIGLMMWMWMSSIIVLLGAALNSEVERQVGAGRVLGKPARDRLSKLHTSQRLGQLGSSVAFRSPESG